MILNLNIYVIYFCFATCPPRSEKFLSKLLNFEIAFYDRVRHKLMGIQML